MTDKERLVELIGNKTCGNNSCMPFNDCETCKNLPLTAKDVDRLADHILADGWMRVPCKVGQILYVIGSGIIHESKVKEYKYCSNSNNDVHWHIVFEDRFTISEAHVGKIAFYTREEAEKALRGGEK